MKLILTRHGETVGNQQGIVQGHLPGKLSDDGLKQAKKLALRLKDEKIDVIYSSDLARAADTAREIAKFHPSVPLHFVRELREANLGRFEGRHYIEIDWSNCPDDVESRESLQKRAKQFLDEVYDKYPDATVLFVGHNGINKAFITVILNLPAEFFERVKQNNTAISAFEIREDKKHIVHLLNCVKHLS